MIRVFLSHSSKDKPFVRELAEFLEREGEIGVWLDEREIAAGENIVGKVGEGLDSDFVLLILSPDSVESEWVKEEWTDAFWDQTNNRKAKLAGVLYRDCRIPRLLRNKKYFDLRTNQPQGFREIRTWLLTQRPGAVERVNVLPTRPPLFVGRENELADLRRRLQRGGAVVHIAEMGGRGKTTLALEFAHRYQRDFEAVYWLPCQSGSLAAIAGELALQLGLKMEGDLEQIVRELKNVCARKRCLLILDNVADESPGELIPGGAASVLITTRLHDLRFLRFHAAVPLPVFTEEQCFELFRKVIGAAEVAGHEGECKTLFKRLGNLPIAVSVSAGLIQYDVRYTIASLARKLPADVTALIGEAIKALEEAPRKLLAAMAACAPEGFRLGLAAEIAELDEGASLDALQQLISRSLAEEVSRSERRYRLHALVREAAGGAVFGQRHAEAIREQFRRWETNWRQCEQDLADLQVALEWMLRNSEELDADSLAHGLAHSGFCLTKRIGHFAEAFAVCAQMARIAEEKKDKAGLQAWLANRAIILHGWGRLSEALALHKEQEGICLELGDKYSLQASYGNQAAVLWTWGRLEEAFALEKKREGLCLELGDKGGLQMSYGSQAQILREWGRLDDALALQEKEEEICLELGDTAGLQRSYGNQAIILRKCGRLEEALALHNKQEGIGWELGDKASLGYCYWSWGLLARAQGDSKGEREKLSAALAIFTELQMPREREFLEAELAKTRAAGVACN